LPAAAIRRHFGPHVTHQPAQASCSRSPAESLSAQPRIASR
jgi:hypothetical protein